MTPEQQERDEDPNRDRRRVEVLRAGGWVPASMAELVVGDRFRMFESDGEPVEDGAEYTVRQPPAPRPDVPGRFGVMCSTDAELAAAP